MNTETTMDNDKSDLTWPKVLALFFSSVLMIPVSVFMHGWVLKILWAWFLIPLGLPAIGMAHALGLSTVLNLMTGTIPNMDEKKDETEKTTRELRNKVLKNYAFLFFRVGFAYLFGYFYHSYMV